MIYNDKPAECSECNEAPHDTLCEYCSHPVCYACSFDDEAEVVERLGHGGAVPQPRLPPTSAKARSKRRPPSAASLLGALQDAVPKSPGRRLRSQPIRKPKETKEYNPLDYDAQP